MEKSEILKIRQFLTKSGAELLPSNNSWEIARWRGNEGFCILYFNKRGKIVCSHKEAHQALKCFQGDAEYSVTPKERPKPLPIVTVYTDASYCPKTKAGGWACWIRYEQNRLEFNGPLKELAHDSTDAELRAIANALVMALKYAGEGVRYFVIVTDSQLSIDAMTGKLGRTSKTKKYYDIAQIITGMIPDGCKVKFNKVKAHSNHDGARSYINKIVDKAASKGRKSQGMGL